MKKTEYQKISLKHVEGPSMGRELLKRLNVARKNARKDTVLVAQIDLIIKSIRLGDALATKLPTLSW